MLADRGHRVLVLDIDSQANLSGLLLQGKVPTKTTLPKVILSGKPIMTSDISSVVINNGKIDFLPSDKDMCGIEYNLPEGSIKEFFISDALSEIADDYDYIIIDTPPAAGIPSVAALLASTDVIIPTTADMLGMEGVEKTMSIIRNVQSNRRLNPSLNILGVVATKYPPRADEPARTAFEELKNCYGKHVVPTPVREGNKVQKALKKYLPIVNFDSNYYVARDYAAVFEFLFPNLKKKQ